MSAQHLQARSTLSGQKAGNPAVSQQSSAVQRPAQVHSPEPDTQQQANNPRLGPFLCNSGKAFCDCVKKHGDAVIGGVWSDKITAASQENTRTAGVHAGLALREQSTQ